MNEAPTSRHGKRRIANDRITPAVGWWTTFVVLVLVAAPQVVAQNAALQQKVAAVKQAAAENKQRLRQYQWTETVQLTLKGEAKPPSTNLCRYGPDGQVQKTPISAPPPPPRGGRLKQKVIANKKAEMKEYMDDVKGLLALYLPPDPQRMEQAFQAGKVLLNPAGSMVNIILTDYAQPGNRMTIAFDEAAKKILSLNVDTYLGETKNVVTLNAQMGGLPDGTNYVQQTILKATAKHLVVNTTNSNYQKLSGF